MAAVPLIEGGVDLSELAIPFLLLCFCLLAFGLVRGAAYIVNVIHIVVHTVTSPIPGLGWLVGKITDPVFSNVEHFLAEAALGVQGAIGFYWHTLGVLVAMVARQFREQAALIERLAHWALPTTWAPLVWHEIAGVRHDLADFARGIDRLAGRFEHFVVSLPGRVEGIIEPRLRTIDHAIDHVIYPDIAGLRSRTREIIDRLDNVWQHVRKLDKLLGTAAFAEAVAVALAGLGLSWIRCRNWNRIGKSVCGLPFQLIDDILGLALAFEVVVDPVALAEAALAEIDGLQSIIDTIAE